jgi:hypothetical protein
MSASPIASVDANPTPPCKPAADAHVRCPSCALPWRPHQERFPESFGAASPQQLYEAENVIREPSLIRVEADEV